MTASIVTAAILGLTKLQARYGPRRLVVSGMTLGGLGMLYLTRLDVGSPYAARILPALVLVGVGIGLVFSTSTSNATLGIEPADAGVASATVNASRQIGASLGIALLATVSASAITHYLASAHNARGLMAHAAVHGDTVGFSWAAAMFAVGAAVSAALFRREVGATDPAAEVRIRYARGGDQAALERLAALDSARVPAAPLLVAEVDGELRAALSMVDSEVIADPFYITAPLVEQLQARAARLAAAGGATHAHSPSVVAWQPTADAGREDCH